MILKTMINWFNLFSIFAFLLFIFNINNFLTTTNIRNKFFLFLLNLILFVCVGFYYNLDGLIMLFFISELTIVLIFITLFSQLYTYYNNNTAKSKFTIVFILLALNYSFYEISLLTYTNFYSYSNVLLNDFYYIYNSYFEKHILLTIITLLIITLYSVFFILLYFQLKSFGYEKLDKKHNINLLRKQNILHQNNYNSKIRIFKNIF